MNEKFNSLLSAVLIGAGWLTPIASTQASEISFSGLPDETKSQIASYLTPYELGRFEQVSKGCQDLCTPLMWKMVARPFKDDYESTDVWDKDKVVVHLLRMKNHTLPSKSAEDEMGNMIKNCHILINKPYTKYYEQLIIFFYINYKNQTPNIHKKPIQKLNQMTNGKDNKELFESRAAKNEQLANERKFWELRYDGSVDAKDLDVAKELLESCAAKKEQWAIERKYMELFMDGGGVYAKDLNTIEDRLVTAKEFLESSIAENNPWAIEQKYVSLINNKPIMPIIRVRIPRGFSYTLKCADYGSLYAQSRYDEKDSIAASRFVETCAANGSRFAQYLYAYHLAYVEQDMEKAKKYIQDYYIGF